MKCCLNGQNIQEHQKTLRKKNSKKKKKEIMIITFATQKGGTGKTTLAIAFANYISAYQKGKSRSMISIFKKKKLTTNGKKTNSQTFQKLYEVETIGEDEEQPFSQILKPSLI